MSFLLPENRSWGVANWVSRGFFADAEPFLEKAPTIADDIRFCIETDTDTVDLRMADQAVLHQLLVLVDSVDAAALKAGPTTFHRAEAFPAYVQQLAQLRATLKELLGTPA